ncbi:MAG: hypothetical protein ACO3FI_09435 [Cyclobacteriaceae bacterium]
MLQLIFGCESKSIRLEDTDLDTWKSDRQGCKNERRAIVSSILSQKENILAVSEASVIETLGKPDQVELYKRNQKLYHYRISPAKTCPSPDSSDLELLIRFNAMGRAKEIFTSPQ